MKKKNGYKESTLWPRTKRQMIKDYIRWLQWRIGRLNKTAEPFSFNGKQYRGFGHPYNRTWTNERFVEIPIALDLLRRNAGKRILEVGNVLSHYIPIAHEVIDKYEQGEKIINQDIVNFESSEAYDFIISISTLEHIGWDEFPQQPQRVLGALDKMKRLLANGGCLFTTFAIGHNPVLDGYVQGSQNPFTRVHYLKRISHNNQWLEIHDESIWQSRYGSPFPAANGIAIGFIEKKGN